MKIRRREFIAGLGGAAVASPFVARAQQRPLPVIGYLSGNEENDSGFLVAPFRQGLSEQGYVEGRNVEILYRYPEIQYTRLRELVTDLVRRRVTIIFAFGLPTALAAIVTAADPVSAGLVANLNRPGGNVTGMTNLIVELGSKRIELLDVPTSVLLRADEVIE
jgi:putative ABC transport system substrate-binding protein